MQRWYVRRIAPETIAEQKFVAAVEADGSETRKMNGAGYRHWPDRLVLKKRIRRPLWIEFKKEGKDATKAQRFLFSWLRSLGQEVIVVDTYDEAWTAYRRHR